MAMAWKQLLSKRTTLSRTTYSMPGFSRFFSQSSSYILKVGIPEFLNGVGRGVETHVTKLESDIGDFQKLFVTRTLKLKKLGVPCKHKPKFGFQTELSRWHSNGERMVKLSHRNSWTGLFQSGIRCITTINHSVESVSQDFPASEPDVVSRIKFKRPDKTARHIMQILDKEAVGEVRAQREILDIKPGYTVQLKVEVPENKRRTQILKGIVIARRNAGLNTTFRIRRLVAGVGVESVFPLYSPNIKEMKVLSKKKVRRAKLYYLRDRMNALNK